MNIRLFCLFVLLPLNLWSADIYVSTTGNDTTGDGSVEEPYATIAHAISVMSGGDDIYLRGGTYQERNILIPVSTSGTSENWSSLQSYPGEWAVIDGQRLCTGNTAGLIENRDGFYHSASAVSAAGGAANYWLFERLELKNGGTEAEGEKTAMAIWWVGGPIKVRYCYIHDNLANDATGNSAGMGGPGWNGCIIEYCLFDHNGSELHGIGDPGGANAFCGIAPEGTWEYNGYTYDDDFKIQGNEYRYNYIKTYGDGGIRTKASSRLTNTRDGSDTANRTLGDKIHHNIVQSQIESGGVVPLIFYQQDWCQIYNNIVDQTGYTKNSEAWPIATRRIRTHLAATGSADIIGPAIYNNTIFNGADAISHYQEYDSGVDWHMYNNILDNNGSGALSALIAYGCSGGSGHYCDSFPESPLTDTNIDIDRNYFYRTTFTNAVHIGNDLTQRYSIAEWEENKAGSDLFSNAYNADDLLYTGTTGASKYTTRAAHVVEGSGAIGTSGIGGNHPYLSGVTIPSYVGAVDPENTAWVAGVLALDATYFTTASGDPEWITGSEDPPAPCARSTASGTAGWR